MQGCLLGKQMKKLTHKQIREYIKKTIKSGNKKRIHLVLKRYEEYKSDNLYKYAEKLFK